MRRVRVTCDRCGKRVPKSVRDYATHRAVLDLDTSGYGRTDGHHRYRFDVCSSACGFACLRAVLDIISSEDEPDEESAGYMLASKGHKS